MSATNWTSLTPPLPKFNHPSWFIRNPNTDQVFVFSSYDGNLWEYKEGNFQLVHNNIDLNTGYMNVASCYWDTKRDALMFALIQGYGDSPVKLYQLQEKIFIPVEIDDSGTPTSYDKLVWDPNSERLVHVRSLHDSEGYAIDAQFLEGTTWSTKTSVYQPFDARISMTAGYDEYRKMVVAIDADGRTVGLDNTNWVPLPKHPTGSWNPAHCVTSPNEGRLMLMHTERDTNPRTIAYELGESSWIKVPTGEIVPEGIGNNSVDYNHGLAFAEEKYALFLQCRAASNRPNYLFTKYDGQQLLPYGPIQAPSTLITSGGRIIAHDHFSFGHKQCPALAEFKDGTWEELPVLEQAVISIIIDNEYTLALTPTGRILSLENNEWTTLSEPSADFTPRAGAAVTWVSDEKTLYVCSGEPTSGGRFLTDLHQFSMNTGWKMLSPKGKKPAFCGSSLGWDAERKVLVLLLGNLKSWKTNENVFEWDGKSWKNYPLKGIFSSGYDATISFDEQLQKMIYTSEFGVGIYLGEGQFQQLHDIDFTGQSDYDPSTRTLYCSDEGLSTLPLGEYLDQTSQKEIKPVEKTPQETAKDAITDVSERYLRYTEDGADKFWIAIRTGKSYELHWGRRGTQGQKKTYTCAAETDAVKEMNKKVKAKLNKDYWDAPEGKAASLLPGKTAYHWKFGKKGDDFVGGSLPQENHPICCDCGEEMIHIVTMDTKGQLQQHSSLSAYMCGNEDGSCQTFEPLFGTNQIILNQEKSKKLQAKWTQSPSKNQDDDEYTEVMPDKISYEEVFEIDPESEDADDLLIHNKCGGHVTWYQGDQTPTCPTCQKEMKFVAQFSEFDEALNFGGDGVAYIFVCPDEHEGAILWQCG